MNDMKNLPITSEISFADIINKINEIVDVLNSKAEQKCTSERCEHKWAIHPLTKTEWCEKCHVGKNSESQCEQIDPLKHPSVVAAKKSLEDCVENGLNGVQNDSCERDEVEELKEVLRDATKMISIDGMARFILKAGYSNRATPAQELVSLNEQAILDMINDFCLLGTKEYRNVLLAKTICSKFGTPRQVSLDVITHRLIAAWLSTQHKGLTNLSYDKAIIDEQAAAILDLISGKNDENSTGSKDGENK